MCIIAILGLNKNKWTEFDERIYLIRAKNTRSQKIKLET
jgi:hypothetical protein